MRPMPHVGWRAVRSAIAAVSAVGFPFAGCALDLGGTGAVPDSDGGFVSTGAGDASLPNLPDAQAAGPLMMDGAVMRDAVTLDAGVNPGLDGGISPGLDAGIDSGLEAGINPGDDADVDAEVGVVGCANGDPSCIVVPTGWSLVAFTSTPTRQCPKGFEPTSTIVFEGPNLDSACSCGPCNVTAQPTCEAGPVPILSSPPFPPMGTPQCSTSPVSELANDPPGACLPYPSAQGGPGNPIDTGYIAPPASGGACSAPGQPDPSNVSFADIESLCTADATQAAACDDKACTPQVDSPFAACIMTAGASVPCPPNSPFSTAHSIATAVGFSCTDCGCTIAADCSGRLELFVDDMCQELQRTAPVNGNCDPSGGPPGGAAYEYAALPPGNVACAANGTSTASDVTTIGAATVCCAP